MREDHRKVRPIVGGRVRDVMADDDMMLPPSNIVMQD